MKAFLTLVLLLVVLTIPETQARNTYSIPQTEVISIEDVEHNRQYELYIKLPENYTEDQLKRYPVIYFTDAVWHIEILSAATAFLFEDVILVGISWQTDYDTALIKEHGSHASRYRDYSILESSNEAHQSKYQFGHASEHLGFIRNVVIPYTESHYRTQPEHRTYFGYSLGGQFGTFALISEPDTFQNYILGSPSLWDRYLEKLKADAATMATPINKRVYMTYGSKEDELGRQVLDFVSFMHAQKDTSLSLHYAAIDGDHGTAFPVMAISSIKWLAQLLSEETEK